MTWKLTSFIFHQPIKKFQKIEDKYIVEIEKLKN